MIKIVNLIFGLLLCNFAMGQSLSSLYETIINSNENRKSEVSYTVDQYSQFNDIYEDFNESNDGWIKTNDNCEARAIFIYPWKSGFYSFSGNCVNGVTDGKGALVGYSKSGSKLKEAYRQESIYIKGKQSSYVYILNKDFFLAFPEFSESKNVVGISIMRNGKVNSIATGIELMELVKNRINFDSSLEDIIAFREDLPALEFSIAEYNTSQIEKLSFGGNPFIYQTNGRRIYTSSSEIGKVNHKGSYKKEGICEIWTKSDNLIRKSEYKNHKSVKVISKREVGKESVKDVCVSGNCEEGYGTFKYANGDTYVGNFRNGQFHGKGKYLWANENIKGYKGLHYERYEGGFANGKFEGQGTLTLDDKTGYKGGFVNGKMHGKIEPFGHVLNFTEYYDHGVKITDKTSKSSELIDCSIRTKETDRFEIIDGVKYPILKVDCGGFGMWNRAYFYRSKGNFIDESGYYSEGVMQNEFLGKNKQKALNKLCNCK